MLLKTLSVVAPVIILCCTWPAAAIQTVNVGRWTCNVQDPTWSPEVRQFAVRPRPSRRGQTQTPQSAGSPVTNYYLRVRVFCRNVGHDEAVTPSVTLSGVAMRTVVSPPQRLRPQVIGCVTGFWLVAPGSYDIVIDDHEGNTVSVSIGSSPGAPETADAGTSDSTDNGSNTAEQKDQGKTQDQSKSTDTTSQGQQKNINRNATSIRQTHLDSAVMNRTTGKINNGSVPPREAQPAPAAPRPVQPAPVKPQPVAPAPAKPQPVLPAPARPLPPQAAPVAPNPVSPSTPPSQTSGGSKLRQ